MMERLSDSGIYEILNTVSGDRYIGQASNFTKRWSKHRRMLQAGAHDNQHLQNAWNKYGECAFSFRVVERCEKAVITAAEQRWMDFHQPAYNKAPAAGSRAGVPSSPETRAKISAAHKGRQKSAEHQAAITLALRGRKMPPLSAEAKAKLSAVNKGRVLGPMPEARKNAISVVKSGVPWSAARRAAQEARA
jgi:group I intron endonuclease